MSAADILKQKNRIDKCCVRMAFSKPIFGSVFIHLRKIHTDRIETIGVGPVKNMPTEIGLYWNYKCIESLNDIELESTLVHEVMHILLRHMFRYRKNYHDFTGYNVAADLAINSYIEVGLPDWAYTPSDFNMPSFKTAEWYYDRLKSNLEANGKDFSVFKKDNNKGNHSMWGEFKHQDIIDEKIKGIVNEAIKSQKDSEARGDISKNLIDMITLVNRNKFPWKKELRYFVGKMITSGRESVRTKLNRRYGLMQPGWIITHKSKLLVAIDTSYSVSKRDVSEFISVINKMKDLCQVEYILFDKEVKVGPKPWPKGLKEFEAIGRGGTDFEPVMEIVNNKKYDGVIICTDGKAPIPAAPGRTKVLWLIPESKDKDFPYGKKLIIQRDLV